MRRFQRSGVPLRAALIIAIAAVLPGCGGGTTATAPASNPLLGINPAVIDFEIVRVGSSSVKTLTITNSGTGTLAVTQATVTGPPFALSGLLLPVYLASGQSSNFTISFAPTASGATSGSLSLVSNASASSTKIEFSGTGVTYQLTPGASSLNFGNVAVASASTKTVSFVNTGTAALTISKVSVAPAQFSLAGPTLAATLQPGQSASVAVAFSPTSTGPASGTLSVLSDASDSPSAVALNGTGATYQLTPGASSLNFGNVAVASTSTKTVSFVNTGTAALTISKVSVAPAQFSLEGPALAAILQPGQSASVTVAFSPTSTGPASGTLSVISDASDSPSAVALSGTGATYQLGVSPSSLNFGSVTVSSTTTQSLALTNTGTANITLSQASITGAGFSLGGLSLPLTLVPGQSVPLNVTFAPSAPGCSDGLVSIVSSASASTMTVAATGVGVTYQLSASAGALSFGDVAVSTKSVQTLTLTNGGTGAITISQATVNGTGFTVAGVTIPATVAPGQTVVLNVTFAPTQAGAVTGAVTVVSNASGSPLVISLAATGATYQLTSSSTALSFGNLAVASSSSQTVTLTNAGTGSLTISQITLSGTEFSLKGPTLPVTLAAGQSVGLTVSFSPTTAGSASGTISVVSGASGSPLILALSGTGQTYQLSAGAASIAFGSVTLGQSAILPAVLTSAGTGSVTISQITVAGAGFTVTSPALPLTLAAGQSTSISITFAPTAVGSVTGALTATSSATGSPLTEALSGTGIHVVDLSWTASTSPVTGYNVYRSTTSAGTFTVLNPSPVTGTSFSDSDVNSGQTYYYKTTAIGIGGVESDYSNVASATISSP